MRDTHIHWDITPLRDDTPCAAVVRLAAATLAAAKHTAGRWVLPFQHTTVTLRPHVYPQGPHIPNTANMAYQQIQAAKKQPTLCCCAAIHSQP